MIEANFPFNIPPFYVNVAQNGSTMAASTKASGENQAHYPKNPNTYIDTFSVCIRILGSATVLLIQSALLKP